MAGLTLATSTTCTDSESAAPAPSLSITCIFTLAVDGPSGKEQSKLPPVAVVWYEPATRVPLFVAPASQSGVPPEDMNVSWPGSVTVNVYLCVVPSSTLARPVTCTVG